MSRPEDICPATDVPSRGQMDKDTRLKLVPAQIVETIENGRRAKLRMKGEPEWKCSLNEGI